MLKSCLILIVGFVFMFGCGGDDGDGNGDPTKTGPFKGVLTGMTETGILSVTIGAAALQHASLTDDDVEALTSSVTGTLTIAGTPVTLTGTFDDVTGAFSISGGGYTLTGTYLDGKITGTFTGPSGGGSFGLLPDTNGAVNVYCGTFMKNGVAGMGTWNLVEAGAGVVTGSASSGVALNGTRSGDAIAMTFSGGSANGTVSGTSVMGTWTATDGSGTWQGTTTGCQ